MMDEKKHAGSGGEVELPPPAARIAWRSPADSSRPESKGSGGGREGKKCAGRERRGRFSGWRAKHSTRLAPAAALIHVYLVHVVSPLSPDWPQHT